ncbi:FixH family protein [Actinokineospora sp. NPDC004072]
MKAVAVLAGLVAAVLLGWLVWPTGGGPTVLRAQAGEHVVELTIAEPRIGANEVRLAITDAGGRPAELDEVTLEPVMPQMGHISAPVPARPDGPGLRRAELALNMGGQWVITVTLRGPDGTADVDFPLLVNG